jgi:hypothetical protein
VPVGLGKGHTVGLRSVGVEVVAMCARNANVVKGVADRLNVPRIGVPHYVN